jgi:hypothetical protein
MLGDDGKVGILLLSIVDIYFAAKVFYGILK